MIFRKYMIFSFILSLIFSPYGCEKDKDIISSVTDYDGNVYNTVQIGNQIWMAENLNTTHYTDGTPIPLVENEGDWNALTSEDRAMSFYNNSQAGENAYGALYTWPAAMNGYAPSETNPLTVQGVCPDGWHLPGDDEWKVLEINLGMTQEEADLPGFRGTNEGSKLAGDTSFWNHVSAVNDNETLLDNKDFGTSGFMALAAGSRTSAGKFNQMGDLAVFWSATESGDSLVLTRLLHVFNTRVYRFTYSKKDGYSVRCIKD